MIPLRCSAYNCYEIPMFDYTINQKKVYKCSQHALHCHNDNCIKKPTKCFKHNNVSIYYCNRHSRKNPLNICKYNECSMIASYGYISDSIPVSCIKHKRPNMEVLVSKCSYFGCKNEANYNYITVFKETTVPKGIYCNQHRKSNMISIEELNDGYVIKTVDHNDPNDSELDVSISHSDIIKREIYAEKKLKHKKIKTDDTNNDLTNNDLTNNDEKNDSKYNIIYNIRKDAELYIKSIISEYILV